jgi:hypothetical protein
MQSNRHFADFRETNSAFFNSNTIGIINAPETVIVAFFLLKGDFERRELLGTTLGKGVF